MAKRIDYAIELLEKCKDMFANIVASGEYCDNDKEDYRKSVEALKWARRQRDNASHNSLHKHDVMQAKGRDQIAAILESKIAGTFYLQRKRHGPL